MSYVEKAENEIIKLNDICDILTDYQENLIKNRELPQHIYGNTGIYSIEELEKLIYGVNEAIEIIDRLKKDLKSKAVELDEEEQLAMKNSNKLKDQESNVSNNNLSDILNSLRSYNERSQ